MIQLRWQVRLGIILVLASLSIYMVKFLVLGDPENTYYYVFNALGFLPINVLFVTLILNELLSIRAKRERLEKLNMVIGTFFSEVGTNLLMYLSDCDPDLDRVRSMLLVRSDWSEDDFRHLAESLGKYQYRTDAGRVDLQALHAFLHEHRDFLLRLLENPVLLEHQTFTELLRAVFHLTEELERRERLVGLPATDLTHLEGDINRVYRNLGGQWVAYMRYLKNNYPYLFSLAMRTNPFDRNSSAIVAA
ncbi:hypothetical protein J2741_001921 [Methanolinea mesophila]|uniref:hypothetical protein n=1 Tax=Methanolinea mesophila TaxID=547055 RepID=UPI001AE5B1CB|nr:hypothetical protein [Methanolinea mesophila]MBP1929374.1 hypothetical protein [Methanolinea mesophila]